jgi:hypothetical protein
VSFVAKASPFMLYVVSKALPAVGKLFELVSPVT